MIFRLSQLLNTPLPILVTEEGIVTLDKAVQPAKALSPTVVTPLAIETVASLLQPLNAPLPILVTEEGIVTLDKAVHSEKALSPTIVM